MTRTALAAYAIRISTLDRNVSQYCRLDNVQGNDFIQIFQSFLSALEGEPISDKEAQKLAQLTRYSIDGRLINATLHMGEHGFESDLIDINNFSTMHHRKMHEAEMRPFHIIVDLPGHADEGILLLQKHGQSGIRQILVQHLEEWFKNNFPDLRILVNPLMPKDAFQPYFNKGRITKIRFIRYNIRRDIADAYDEGDHREVEGSMELVVRARRNKSIPMKDKIWSRFTASSPAPQTPLIEISDFDYEDVKVEVTLGDIKRTIDLGKPGAGHGVFDITERVKLGQDGFPTRESVIDEAKEIVHDLRSAMGMED